MIATTQGEGVLGPGSSGERLLYELAPVGVVLIDSDGRFLSFNERAHQQLGYTREEFARLRVADIDAEDRPGDFEARMSALESGGAVEFDTRQRHKSGELRDVHVRVRRFPGGDLLRVLGVMQDVTEQRRSLNALAASKARLQASQERLRKIIEAEPECVKVVGPTGRLEDMNPAGLAMLDAATLEEAQSIPLGEFVRPEHRAAFFALHARVMAGGSGRLEFETTGLRGTRRWLETNAVPLRGPDGAVVALLAVTRDITERRRAEEVRERVQRLESLAVLAGGVAHDFNNLLTGILGNVSLALSDDPPADERRELLLEAQAAAVRAQSLTRQLLTFSRGGAPVRSLVAFEPLVRETASFAARGAKCSCAVEAEPGLWPLEADAGQLAQVVQNLVLNAIEAMPDGGTVSLALANVRRAESTSMLPAGDYVRLRVTDHGRGIPPERLLRIFDPFYSTKGRGSGLGLTVTHSIVVRHGGQIEVSSQPGAGTTFEVLLPARRDGTPRAAPGATATSQAPPRAARVLLMDDEPSILRAGARVLGTFGCEVECAADGAAAIERWRAARAQGRPFDLLVFDLTVPGGMGGAEAIARLRELDPGVRAIASSGYSDSSAGGAGFVATLPKPWTADDLRQVVAQLLAEGR